MAEPNVIPQIDYTSRDFEAIRDDMISLIQYFLPEWKNRDASDFGITLIELFAYMGDIMSFYIDRAANESFILTASQRDSVLRMARLLGYTPTPSTPATVTLSFSTFATSSQVVPAGTQVSTTSIVSGENVEIIFETNSAITVPASGDGGLTAGAVVTVVATQGYTVEETGIDALGISSGLADQIFLLADYPVIKDSIEITVDNVVYTFVDYLVDYSGNDPVYTIDVDGEDRTYVIFGDNVGGRIPPRNGTIEATYRVGAGDAGNVAENTLTEIVTNYQVGLQVNNEDPASGGSDSESTDSVRLNTPISIRSLNRAVTLEDYASLAVQILGVAKANAIANTYNSITLYYAPSGDPGVEDDNVTPTLVFTNLQPTVQTFFADKMPPTTTLTLQPPSYVDVNIEIDVQVLDQYRQSTVTNAVQAVLSNFLAFDNVNFKDRITLQDLLTEVSTVSGVAYSTITLLDRDNAITAAARASGSPTITLTTLKPHNYVAGNRVTIDSVDATVNGNYSIASAPTSTTFTVTGTTTTLLALTGLTGTIEAVVDIICSDNEIPQAGTLTITPSGGIA
jgi:uncharacterized phage protein gp47/JayE